MGNARRAGQRETEVIWLAWLAAAIVLGSPGGWLLLEILNLRDTTKGDPE